MRIAVLGSPSSWYFADLQRAARKRQQQNPSTPISLECLPFGRIESAVSKKQVSVRSLGEELAPFDAVLVRTMPPGSLEQVVFRMNVLAQLAQSTVVVNPPRAIEVAVDKYLATCRLRDAGLLVPESCVCQHPDEAMQAFFALGEDVVLKPVFGSEGRGIARLTDEAIALRTFKLLAPLGALLYLQAYVPHQGFDVRILQIGTQQFAMRRSNALDWRTNVSRGAETAPFELTTELAQLAQQAADVVEAPLAGVDLLQGQDQQWYALEVNAVPGWKALAKTLQVDVATLVLEYLTKRVNNAS